MPGIRRLVDFPYVVVRPVQTKRCAPTDAARDEICSEILLDDLIVRLSNDCPWRDDPRSTGCGAQFADLPPRRPPDMPAARRLRVVAGGKG